jgi:hypothetical protein
MAIAAKTLAVMKNILGKKFFRIGIVLQKRVVLATDRREAMGVEGKERNICDRHNAGSATRKEW